VGCKAKEHGAANTKRTKFYLNYVGCKALLIQIAASLQQRFTLTMWDVKYTLYEITDLAIQSFYLNYVGCKVIILRHDYKIWYSSFTLTMWDVKISGSASSTMKWMSFTLTMWDVKLISLAIADGNVSSFYLNYVGCKVVI